MSKNTNKISIWGKLKVRYQLNVMNKESYEVSSIIILSRLSGVIWLLTFILLIGLISFLVISFTPIRQYIPGYGKIDERRLALKHQLFADSLTIVADQNSAKMQILEKVLRGDFDTTMHPENLFVRNFDSLLIYSESIEDSMLRSEVELREKFSIFDDENLDGGSNNKTILYPPVKGIISDSFQYKEKHFGIDIIAKKNSEVKSVLDGIVIFSEFTIETGYIIGIHHDGDLISIYKHNSSLKKKSGESVRQSEVIAITGGTGELSSGPHLHLELWIKGLPVNPIKYINFD